MNLHEQIALDLENVFFNLDEFACIHDFNGRRVKCIVDDGQGFAGGGSRDGLSNTGALGLAQCDRLIYCQACELVPQPLPGEQILMDGNYWLVGEAGVTETEGLLKLALVRVY